MHWSVEMRYRAKKDFEEHLGFSIKTTTKMTRELKARNTTKMLGGQKVPEE